MADYDALNQGLIRKTVKVFKPAENFSFFRDVVFGGSVIGTDQDFIDLDTQIGKIAISEEAVKGLDPNRVNHGTSFDTKHIASAYYFDEDTVNLAQAKNRLFEEPLDAPWTVAERELAIASKKRDALDQAYTSREEALAAYCALNGKFATRGNGEQTFPMDVSLLSLAGANLLTKPFETISAAAIALFKKGVVAKRLILNPTDAANLCASSSWQSMLDKRRVEVGTIAPGVVQANGLAYVGTIVGIVSGAIQVYTYAGFDPNKNFYLPQGSAMLLPESAIGSMGYTGLLDVKGEVQDKVAAKRLFKVFGDQRGFLVDTKIQGQTAPAPLITAIDGYGVITGIPTV